MMIALRCWPVRIRPRALHRHAIRHRHVRHAAHAIVRHKISWVCVAVATGGLGAAMWAAPPLPPVVAPPEALVPWYGDVPVVAAVPGDFWAPAASFLPAYTLSPPFGVWGGARTPQVGLNTERPWGGFPSVPPATGNSSQIPEPSSFALLAPAVLAAAAIGRVR